MLFEIISDSIRYPFSRFTRTIFLGILGILSILIIPLFVGLGYCIRAIKVSIEGEETLPPFDNWGELLLNGLKLFIMDLCYFIIPIILIVYGCVSTVMTLINQNPYLATMPGAQLYIRSLILKNPTVILGMMLIPIFGIFEKMGRANLAYYGSLGAAFNFSEIFNIISEIGWDSYLAWYVVVLIVQIFLYLFSLFLLQIPVIGSIISSIIVMPILLLFDARAIALRYVYRHVDEE